MNYSNNFYLMTILAMFVITFGIRFIIFAMAHKVVLPQWLEQALNYVPVAVLTAIITPMIIYPSQAATSQINMQNPWLIASVVAFLSGLLFRKPLLTIFVGLVVFFTWKWWFV